MTCLAVMSGRQSCARLGDGGEEKRLRRGPRRKRKQDKFKVMRGREKVKGREGLRGRGEREDKENEGKER